MTPLAIAVERRQWEVVALRLLLGVSDAARGIPPEALPALLDLLSPPDSQEGRRGR